MNKMKHMLPGAKRLWVAVALSAGLVALPLAVHADTISIGASCSGGAPATLSTSLTGIGAFIGPSTCGAFTITSVNATGSPIVPEPTLLTNTINVSSTGGGTITIFVTESNITSPTGISEFLSQFTSNNLLTGGSTVTEETLIDTGNGIFTGSTLNGPVTFATLGAASSLDLTPSLSNPFSETTVFTLNATAAGQDFNDTINIRLPEPASLSLVGFGLLGLGTGLRKRLLKS